MKLRGKSNPLGKDTKNISCNVPSSVHSTLKELADRSTDKQTGKKMGISTYAARVLTEIARRGVTVEQNTVLIHAKPNFALPVDAETSVRAAESQLKNENKRGGR